MINTTSIQLPVVLTVAGLDPSGGAGILADIKTISAFGCYGLAAVTSLTFQNTRGVYGTVDQTGETVRLQIEPLFADFEIAALKTGMLPSADVVRNVASMIRSKSIPVVVVDPVLRSSSGFELSEDESIEAFKRCLFPLASVVTPNAAEASRITGIHIKNQVEMERAAEAILELGARAVLITGGDGNSDLSTDLLLDDHGAVVYSTEKIKSHHTHGTGCTLASALACLLARGHSLRESIPTAKRYISAAIQNAPGLGHGSGPLNHFPPGFVVET